MKIQSIFLICFYITFLPENQPCLQLSVVAFYFVNLANLQFLLLRFDIQCASGTELATKEICTRSKRQKEKTIAMFLFRDPVRSLALLSFWWHTVITDLVPHFVGLELQEGQQLIQLPLRVPPSASSNPGPHSAPEPSKATSTDHWHHWNWRLGDYKR